MKLKKAQKSVKGKEKPAKNVKPKEKVAKISEKPVKPKEKAVKTSKSEKKKQNDEKIARAESILSNFEKPSKPQDPVITKNANKRHLKKALGQDGLLVKHQEGTKWYSYQIDKLQDENEEKMEGAKINELLIEGRDILAQDSALLQTKEKQENGSEASWLYSVISKGTASDKRTAMQLQMHKSPIHSLEYVERLIGYCAKQGTRDIIDVIPILEDVFANHCLPENRKLVPFSKRPFGDLTTLSSGNDRSRRKILLLWAFEHELKILYQQFIQALVEIVKRPLEDVVKKALRTLANLLISRPESESLILSALVNSFGHPNYKIGSHSVHLFEDISRKHPAMRIVIVDEIERLIFRKNVNERAHLYSVTFLSQMKFSTRDSGDLTCRLMSIYLSLFKTIVHKKITDNRLLPIILAGANRAFPYAKDVDKLLGDVKDVYYLAHNSNYRTAIPALRLLFQFHNMNDYVSDRFYNALYRKLLDTCPPAAYAQLLKLLFDTMKEDPSAQRVRAFVKRLLQVAVNVSSEFAASILILISKLKTERKDENLLILSKDADPSLRVVSNLDDDEDEERYVDLDAEGNEIRTEVKGENKAEEDDDVIPENADEDTKKIEKGKLDASSNRGWVHRKTSGRGAAKTPYDPMARNPLFVDAQHVADNELLLLSNHFHPSVSVFAKCLLEGGEVKYGGDALNDFTLMAFLDRFAFRNPKEITTKLTGRVVRKKAHDPWGVRKLAVDSNEYTQKKRDEIPADERFLHRYASTVYRDKKVKKEEGKEDEDEWEYAESVNSEEFDTIMERFEPGELNEEFDIDYSKEFSSEKNKRNKPTIADEDVDMDEDDDLDLDDGDDEPEDGMEDGDDIEDDDDDEEPEDDDDDDDDDNDFDGRDGSSNVFGDDESSDEEIGENDYELAGDRFAEMLENLEEEEHEGGKGKKKGNAGGKKKFNAKRPAAKKGGFKGAKRPRRH